MGIIENIFKIQNEYLKLQKIAQPELLNQFINLYPDTAHFIYELLQNAEDAEATEVIFELYDDRLIFLHNGRTFNEKDIESICKFGESTKKGDETAIGKFGIGFKSIFAYTKSPFIWSPTFNFKIEKFILPIAIDQFENLNNRTRFEFPFNHEKKTAQDAYKEINEGLYDLSQITLLFLNNIQEIQIIIDKPNKILEIIEIEKVRHKNSLLEIKVKKDKKENTNFEENNSLFFLTFSRQLTGFEGIENRFVDLAFQISMIDEKQFYNPLKNIENQFKIVKPNKGEVSIYFPAKKESSKLRFHINGPFQSTPDRSSIKNNSFNSSILDEICLLFETSILEIKKLGLLNRDFLEILPITIDDLDEDYLKFQSKLKEIFTKNSVLPTSDGQYSTLPDCIRGTQQLRSFLNNDDLNFINGKKFWALPINRNNSRPDNLLKDLEIDIFSDDSFLYLITSRSKLLNNETFQTLNYWDKSVSSNLNSSENLFMSWLNEKDIVWLQKFYAYLGKQIIDEKNDYCPYHFTDAVIIKLENGNFSTPENCYFFSNDLNVDKFPVVNKNLTNLGTPADKEDAQEFFKNVGVKSFDEKEKLKIILESRYGDKDKFNPKITDILMFLKFYQDDPSTAEIFKKYKIFYVKNPFTNSTKFTEGYDIFLDEPYCEKTSLREYFKHSNENISVEFKYLEYGQLYELNYDCKKLNIKPEKLFEFCKACNGHFKLNIYLKSIDKDHPNYEHLKQDLYKNAREMHTGINKDHELFKLNYVLKNITPEVSFVIWETMVRYKNNLDILKATYQANKKRPTYTADSSLILLLKDNPWILNNNSEFITPQNATKENIHKNYDFVETWEWLKSIEFGLSNEEKIQKEKETLELTKNLNLNIEHIEAFKMANEIGLTKDDLLEIINKKKNQINSGISKNEVKNPERRSQKIQEQINEATDSFFVKRMRSIPEGVSQTKGLAAQYLTNEYTNHDKKLFCQICNEEMPFKLNNGNYYFEKVKFLNFDKEIHQNYLTLCANHSSMFQYTLKESDYEIRNKIKDVNLEGNGPFFIKITIGQIQTKVFFTKKHLFDIKEILKN